MYILQYIAVGFPKNLFCESRKKEQEALELINTILYHKIKDFNT